MRKFGILLNKEIRELLTLQLILPLIITVVLFMIIGQTIGGEIEKIEAQQKIWVSDEDATEMSQQLIAVIESAGVQVIKDDTFVQDEDIATARENGSIGIIVIPQGLEQLTQNQQPVAFSTYALISNFSVLSSAKVEALGRAVGAGGEFIKRQALVAAGGRYNQDFFSQPIIEQPHVVIGD